MNPPRQFEQIPLIPGHEPADEMPSARKWAAKAAGRGARVHYTGPEDNHRMPGAHGLTVTKPGRKGGPRVTVSQIHWYPTSANPEASGEIVLVQTDKNYEGQGLATGLFHIARSLGIENAEIAHIQHGRVQTPKGRQWARKVGES